MRACEYLQTRLLPSPGTVARPAVPSARGGWEGPRTSPPTPPRLGRQDAPPLGKYSHWFTVRSSHHKLITASSPLCSESLVKGRWREAFQGPEPAQDQQ